MKFNVGDKVIFKNHKTQIFDLPTEGLKHFTVGQVYEIERIACRVSKTYTLKNCKTYVFESQLSPELIQ